MPNAARQTSAKTAYSIILGDALSFSFCQVESDDSDFAILPVLEFPGEKTFPEYATAQPMVSDKLGLLTLGFSTPQVVA